MGVSVGVYGVVEDERQRGDGNGASGVDDDGPQTERNERAVRAVHEPGGRRGEEDARETRGPERGHHREEKQGNGGPAVVCVCVSCVRRPGQTQQQWAGQQRVPGSDGGFFFFLLLPPSLFPSPPTALAPARTPPTRPRLSHCTRAQQSARAAPSPSPPLSPPPTRPHASFQKAPFPPLSLPSFFFFLPSTPLYCARTHTHTHPSRRARLPSVQVCGPDVSIQAEREQYPHKGPGDSVQRKRLTVSVS